MSSPPDFCFSRKAEAPLLPQPGGFEVATGTESSSGARGRLSSSRWRAPVPVGYVLTRDVVFEDCRTRHVTLVAPPHGIAKAQEHTGP